MNRHTTAQLAEIRRRELTADAAAHRQIRECRAGRNHPRRPFTAFHSWLAAGQL